MRIFKYKTTIIRLVLFMGIIGLVGEATAQPRPNVYDGGNKWLITAYDDTSPIHQEWATQCICFLPYVLNPSITHIQGVWYSCSFPNWRGRYSQEGDRVLMHADYANGLGHDGMVIELFAGVTANVFLTPPPRDEGAGQWTEWREGPTYGSYGLTIGWVNTRLRRVGKCPLPFDISKMSQADIEKLSVELSEKVKPRLRKDGKPAESPLDPEQVPLREEK